jgi:hypothetical protein
VELSPDLCLECVANERQVCLRLAATRLTILRRSLVDLIDSRVGQHDLAFLSHTHSNAHPANASLATHYFRALCDAIQRFHAGLQSLARLQYYSKAAKARAVPAFFNMRAVGFALDLVLISR